MIGPGALLNRRYQLNRELARGGMAVVWDARDTMLDRPVAVKTLHPQFAGDPEFLERFRREARAAAGLAHPNIVAVYDVGEDSETSSPFIVMELVDGESLKDRIRRHGPQSNADIREVGAAVASALDYAHRRGVVHRDVKPQNILIGEDGRARLTDFGIAQALAAGGLTRTGAVMGSVHYLAPELARGRPATSAVDVYGLGAVLYEMATGRVPFTGDTELAVALAHAEQPAVPPRQVNPGLAPDLEATILHAMAKSPTDRFASAGEMARALTAPVASQATSRMDAVPAAVAAAYRSAGATSAPPARPPRVAATRAQSRGTPPAAAPVRGATNGFIVLLLVLALILLALGAGFFGLASLSRDFRLPSLSAPTVAPFETPMAVVGSPSAGPTPTPAASTAPATTPTAAATPTPTVPAATPTATAPPATPTPRPIAVPNVVGRPLADARAAIEGAALSVSGVTGVNVNAPKDQVVEERPAAGSPLPPGSGVMLVVGTGQVLVPQVAGRPRNEATRLIQEAGLNARVRDVQSDRPRGTALGTVPAAGEQVPRGSEIELQVAR